MTLSILLYRALEKRRGRCTPCPSLSCLIRHGVRSFYNTYHLATYSNLDWLSDIRLILAAPFPSSLTIGRGSEHVGFQ